MYLRVSTVKQLGRSGLYRSFSIHLSDWLHVTEVFPALDITVRVPGVHQLPGPADQ